jgi:hypothetical protein
MMKSNKLTKINSPYAPPLVGPACHLMYDGIADFFNFNLFKLFLKITLGIFFLH